MYWPKSLKMVITETQVGFRAYMNTLTKVSEPGEGFENGSSQYSINPTANHFFFTSKNPNWEIYLDQKKEKPPCDNHTDWLPPINSVRSGPYLRKDHHPGRGTQLSLQ